MWRPENQTDRHFFPLDYKSIYSGSVTVAWQDTDGGAVEADEKDKQRQKVLYEQIIAAFKSCQNYRIYEKSAHVSSVPVGNPGFFWTLTFWVEDVSIK